MHKTKKIKLAFYMHSMGIGGVETVLVNTINALIKQGVDITLYCNKKITEPVHAEWLAQHPEIKTEIYYPHAKFLVRQSRKHPIIRFVKRTLFGIYRLYRNAIMARRVRAQNFDAIIDYISGYSATQLKNISGVKKLTWVHCSMNYFKEHNFIQKMNQYDYIIPISDSFRNEFCETYPEFAGRTVRIYNPINFAHIKDKLKTATIPDGKYFTCVSRLDSDKDIYTLIDAFDKFWQNEGQPDVKLYIVGDGECAKDFKNVASNVAAAPQIIFTGKQSNPFGYMSGALAHILSSFNEGLPTVLMEAMSVGTLNISSNCPNGPHEILMDGQAGILFEPGNVNELAQCLSDVYNKNVKIKALTNTATKSLERFNPDEIANDIIRLVRDGAK